MPITFGKSVESICFFIFSLGKKIRSLLDTNTHIATLIRKIHDINGIFRIRLGSLEPSQIDSKFLEILSLPKLERHLHIALQHTSEAMLKIMNRKNTFIRDLELFRNITSVIPFCAKSRICSKMWDS